MTGIYNSSEAILSQVIYNLLMSGETRDTISKMVEECLIKGETYVKYSVKLQELQACNVNIAKLVIPPEEGV